LKKVGRKGRGREGEGRGRNSPWEIFPTGESSAPRVYLAIYLVRENSL
jgi:hypothetical protein